MATPLRNVHPLFELRGRNYIVTGGGQGIGFAVVRAIAEYGGNIAILDLREQPIEEYNTLACQFGVRTIYLKTDVSNEESLTSSFSQAVEFLGCVHGAFTSAGIVIDKPFIEQTWAEVQRIQDVNVLGTFFATQLVAKQLLKQETPGSIVQVASITAHGVLPKHRMSAYNASKGAVKVLTEALGVELAPHGIRVNSISPGFIDSYQTRVVRDLKSPEDSAIMDTAPPLARIGNFNDLTGAVIYLLSDASAYTVGADIAITGGLHVGRIEM
ncbi:NAD(P)-binding protein [Aspergillus bertholletiae]|uniref:NAD(P)-binding protein n=1 Tax=Aspergillus bertholletiae TaxID=1226010 RepID=A0A5N7APK9_9EURO|nr:NAD(P)-binding protein [Aspergillus bertholletiae]